MFGYIKQFYIKYERHLSSAFLLLGFVIDNLTLTRIDLLYDNIVLFSYILISAGSIIFINAYRSGRVKWDWAFKIAHITPLIMQFAFGGLFSWFVVFYSRSASLAGSWQFIIMLLILLIGNEFFKRQYARLTFQVQIFFISIFSFLIFFVPVLLGRMGVSVFILSGMLSLVIIGAFIHLIRRITPEFTRRSLVFMRLGVLSIFVFINILYFSNIIPPIPLSLADSGVFHNVARAGDGYIASAENKKWYEKLALGDVLHIAPGERIYFYSAVFAPTRLDTEIFHLWEYFDEDTGTWSATDRIALSITGGRDGGYRGYTFKSNISPGGWRVSVENGRGQLLGRTKFYIETATSDTELDTVVLY